MLSYYEKFINILISCFLFSISFFVIIGIGSFIVDKFKDKNVKLNSDIFSQYCISGLSIWIITHRFFLREWKLNFIYKFSSVFFIGFGIFCFLKFLIINKRYFMNFKKESIYIALSICFITSTIFFYPILFKGSPIIVGNADVYGHLWLLDAVNIGFDWNMGLNMFKEWTGTDKWYKPLEVWAMPDFRFAQYIEWLNRSTRYGFPILVNSLSRLRIGDDKLSILSSLWMCTSLSMFIIYSRLKLITNSSIISFLSSFIFSISSLGSYFYYSGIYSQIICTPFILYSCTLPITYSFGIEKNTIKNFLVSSLVFSALFTVWGEGLQIVFIFYFFCLITLFFYYLLIRKKIGLVFENYFNSIRWILATFFTSILFSFIYFFDWIKWSILRLSVGISGGIGHAEWNFLDTLLGKVGLETIQINKDQTALSISRLSSSNERYLISLFIIFLIIATTFLNNYYSDKAQKKIIFCSSALSLVATFTFVFFNILGNLYALIKVGYLISPFIIQGPIFNIWNIRKKINISFLDKIIKSSFALFLGYIISSNLESLILYAYQLPTYKVLPEYSIFRSKFPIDKKIAVITPTNKMPYLLMQDVHQMFYVNSGWAPKFNSLEDQKADIYSYIDCNVDEELSICKDDSQILKRNKVFIKEDLKVSDLLNQENNIDGDKLSKTIEKIFYK